MPRRADEFLELTIGDRRAVYPEFIDRNPVRRSFFGIVFVRPHAERTAGNSDHTICVGDASYFIAM